LSLLSLAVFAQSKYAVVNRTNLSQDFREFQHIRR